MAAGNLLVLRRRYLAQTSFMRLSVPNYLSVFPPCPFRFDSPSIDSRRECTLSRLGRDMAQEKLNLIKHVVYFDFLAAGIMERSKKRVPDFSSYFAKPCILKFLRRLDIAAVLTRNRFARKVNRLVACRRDNVSGATYV
jgi:hypothetical protein